ncbi:MAG: response regulator transcription factor [Ramlibacter sp.]|nr:response regulator transcription factor [Ramlibacter sp.]MBX3657181.1 response regulator transcription factor [Ramlibacter sp.]MCW5649383.1 response regulator transcription factor [Ramlibacter sp.]
MNSVLIIDDHDIVRFGFETLISECPQLSLVGSAPTLAKGLDLIAERKPALVISDMSMDDSKGLDTVKAVVAAQKPRCTLIVSMHDEMLYGEQVLSLGAQGYIMKESAHATVVDAALTVLRGETWVSQRLNSKLLDRLLQRNRSDRTGNPADAARTLTLRELEVLENLRTGKTTKEIAFDLGLSTRTVDIHRANIKKKLGLRSGTELIAFALAKT